MLKKEAIGGIKSPSELVIYNRRARVFASISDISNQEADQVEVYEFIGENFQRIA